MTGRVVATVVGFAGLTAVLLACFGKWSSW